MIKVENLFYSYPNNGFKIDIPFQLTIKEGVTGLLGRNGAGKTTFLRLLSGLKRYTKGHVEILQSDIKDENMYEKIKKDIFYLPDENILFDNLTVQENLELFCDIRFGDKNKWTKSFEMIQYFSLDESLKKPFGQCSHGTRKKTEIVCAFIASPRIYFLDEPYNGLDVLGIKLLNDLIKRNQSSLFLLSSHIVTILEQMAERILIIDNGLIIDDIMLPIANKLEDYYIEKVFKK